MRLPNIWILLALGVTVSLHSGHAASAANPGTPWPATDALSRSMSETAELPQTRPDRFVGIFYFLWHNRGNSTLPNDLSKILPQDPDLLQKPNSPLWGPRGPYYWGQPLSPRTDPNWMWLLIDADGNSKTGWEGYEFILNRTKDGEGTWLEKNSGGWTWKPVQKIAITANEREVMLTVPRRLVGLPNGDAVRFNFKWWDNAQKPGDIMDTYLSGDVAPEGRFNYRYSTSVSEPE